MDININVKITLDETPALINSLSVLVDLLQALVPKTKNVPVQAADNVPSIVAAPEPPMENPAPVQAAVAASAIPAVSVNPAPVAVPVPASPVAAPAASVAVPSFPASPAPAAPAVPSFPASPAPAVPVASPPAYTLDQISRAGAALLDANKMDLLLALLNRYNVQAITQLRPEQYGAFATELRALGAAI